MSDTRDIDEQPELLAIFATIAESYDEQTVWKAYKDVQQWHTRQLQEILERLKHKAQPMYGSAIGVSERDVNSELARLNERGEA